MTFSAVDILAQTYDAQGGNADAEELRALYHPSQAVPSASAATCHLQWMPQGDSQMVES